MKKTILITAAALLFTVVMAVLSATSALGAYENVVFLRNGGEGDGSSYESALGDFKEAVKSLSKTGGCIVVCGEYTYNELIVLSSKSGTANLNRTIRVTSVYGDEDYRKTRNAAFCAGDGKGSANMILAGRFIFENINIVTDGGDTPRAIICNGYSTVFGEGIVCRKNGDAPYISIVGRAMDDSDASGSVNITVKSGTYNYVCAGDYDGNCRADTLLTIEGGVFEGSVSASGAIESESEGRQQGTAVLNINGGTFYGDVGALTAVDEDFVLTVNGGTFRKNIFAKGIYNTVNINGGNLQELVKLELAPYVPKTPETYVDGEPVETDASDVKITSVSINSYSGDVKKLSEKIVGEGAVININTEGGSDIEIGNETETDKVIHDETLVTPEQTEESADDTELAGRYYILGSKENTVTAACVIGAVIFAAIVLLVYRFVHRKR